MQRAQTDDCFSFVYEANRHVAEEGDKCPDFIPRKELAEVKKIVNQKQFPLLFLILYSKAEIQHKDFPKLQQECDTLVPLLTKKESTDFIKTLRPSEHSEGNLYVLFPLSEPLEQRITTALEKQYHEKVFINHLNIEEDTASVDFKTDGGMFGLARFRFTNETLERIG